MGNLARKTIIGLSWASLSQISRIGLQFIITVILVRLLEPSDFGLLAMASVFINLGFLIKDFGMVPAIVQSQGLNNEDYSSIFWFNVSLGGLITLLYVVFSGFIARFYNEPKLQGILIVLSFNFLISSSFNIYLALLTKRMDFKKIAIVEIAAVLVGGIVGVLCAFEGYGVWSLVFQQISNSLTMAILYYILGAWRPGFVFHVRSIKKILSFSLGVLGFRFLNYLNRNADNFLIGKFIGPIELGYYNLSYKILLFPLSNINGVITRVVFPAFSTIQRDIKRIRENYLNLIKMLAIVVFPLMVFVIVLSPDIVLLFFGKKWLPVVPIMRLLAFVGILQSMINPVGILYLSLGKPHVQFLWEIIVTIVSLTAFILGVSKGVVVVTEYYTIAVLILFYPALKIVFTYIELSFIEFIKTISKELLVTILIGALIYFIRFDVISKYSLIFLGYYLVAGFFLYVFILGYLEKKFLAYIWARLRKSKDQQ